MRQLLKQLISINRMTITNGTNMGVGQTPVPIFENVAASVQPATSSVMQFYAQRQLKVTQTIFVAGTLDLNRGDTITCEGIVYQVIGWRDLCGRNKLTAIDVEEYL